MLKLMKNCEMNLSSNRNRFPPKFSIHNISLRFNYILWNYLNFLKGRTKINNTY